MSDETQKTPVDLQADGLLWLINRVVFHPRGFALAIVRERPDVSKEHEEFISFELLGNGDEPWHYEQVDEDALFRAVEAAFARVRKAT